ncbi:hypothetical protein OZ410_01570 [Robiginitalea sp. M366]|uniref:hypothetical protein n=1 Tax=Robiginitalea aestuariiviva TaxID=3036903 RepID=UPI00240DA6A8|nr:hypothetical protein [Robiginitalea aestuariiviva]MDG1570988.1 hypothetical protein [Robiginitalea aestuariiviva]
MKRGILPLALLMCAWAGAQYNGNKEMRHHGMLHIVEYELPVNGSPYVDEVYKKGTITIDNAKGTLEEEKLMRFNAFTGDMEYMADGKSRSLLRRENIHVVLDGLHYEVHPYRMKDEVFRAFFNPLNPGEKVVLYQRPLKHFRKPKMPEHGYEDARDPEYFDASTYYLRIDGAPMVEVKLTKRDLLDHLEAHRGELVTYIRENDLNLRKLADAVALVRYFNTLEALP